MLQARDIPNLISVMRLLLVPPVVWLILQGRYDWALWLFLFAGASDGVDGFLARHFNWRSRLGGLLDPVADKLLMVCCFLALGWQQLIPLWIVVLVVARDVIIFAGALVYHFRIEALDAAPTIVSKLNTLAQILLILAVLWHAGIHPLASNGLLAMEVFVVVTTVFSGIDYVWTWGRRARHHTRGRAE